MSFTQQDYSIYYKTTETPVSTNKQHILSPQKYEGLVTIASISKLFEGSFETTRVLEICHPVTNRGLIMISESWLVLPGSPTEAKSGPSGSVRSSEVTTPAPEVAPPKSPGDAEFQAGNCVPRPSKRKSDWKKCRAAKLLQRFFGKETLTFQQIKPIAAAFSRVSGIHFDREAQRRKSVLVSWCDEHMPDFGDFLTHVIIQDEDNGYVFVPPWERHFYSAKPDGLVNGPVV